MQQGHQSNATAQAGDTINVNPMSYGGGIQMGSINTGDKTQAPSNVIGGSTSSASFDLKIPSMNGGGKSPINPDDLKPVIPDIKPDIPDIKPDIPDIKPHKPDAQPVNPNVGPVNPNVRPVGPVSPQYVPNIPSGGNYAQPRGVFLMNLQMYQQPAVN